MIFLAELAFKSDRLLAYQNSKPYDGRANWIWEASKVRIGSSEATLKKEFTLDAPVKSAVLIASADDMGTVSINGQKAGNMSGYTLALRVDCTELLKEGKNEISAKVADAGQLPCGFLADLRIELANGTKLHIVTDNDWTAENGAEVTVVAPVM